MQALFFGSIGTVIETSELQRTAFNRAFAEQNLDWLWDLNTYRAMLVNSGGKDRIAHYGKERGVDVAADEIHKTKTRIFTELLTTAPPPFRPGVVDSLRLAKASGMKTAFVSSTSKDTINMIMRAHSGVLKTLFDVVTSADDAYPAKPDAAIYTGVAQQLNIDLQNTIIVEDNRDGLMAASKAGGHVIAYLGANTQDHDTSHAHKIAGQDIFPTVHNALTVQEEGEGAINGASQQHLQQAIAI